LRIDGRMKKFFIFKKELFRFLSSYIKLISNLDITQTRIPMDSRFSLNVSEKKYDFRVSTMPTVSGESIVLRILDKTNIEKNLNNLGFNESLLNEFKNIINLAQGLVLVAGPTGSGKTTTLYSLLKELNSEDKKIITVEDPVEYKIEDITQISINSKIGLNFELVLKNILRQDPDVIFIGEIRDKFSLDIALQASLTGHLVIATIHSNSALQTITRLIDLNADTFLLSTTLKYILSQRLVINYCKKCQGKGCSHCNFTKFYDRSCIAELLKVDEKISSMIFTKSSLIQIEKYLKTINYKTILEDGIEKVNNGITSIEEIYKVL
jgi:general secretion pathway protein E